MRTGYITFPGYSIFLLLGLILLSPKIVLAEEVSEQPIEPQKMMEIMPERIPEVEVESKSKIFAVIDGPRDYLSEKIVTYSKAVDEFFGDPRYFQENNKSLIQLELNQIFAQGGNRSFLFEGKAKLDLPAAQRRFQIVLESNPEQKTAGETKKDQPSAARETAKPEQYAASVRYEQSEESRWHFSSDAGAKFQFPLDFFVRARGSYSVPFEIWRFKVAETVFWFGTIGLGQTTQLDLERKLSEPVLFRATSTATCLEAPQNCDLRQDFSIFHTLNERSAMLYQASVIGVSEPDPKETAYVLLMKYRYRLHKDWVFFEISPQMNFPRTDDFRLNASLLLRLEILFGAKQ